MDKLIEFVRKYPCLYDQSDKNYKNIVLKAEIWETIGKDLNENAETAKLKWKNLRDNYVRHKKSLCKGQSTKKLKWPWYNQLQFLNAALVPRPKSSNICITSSKPSLRRSPSLETVESPESTLARTEPTSLTPPAFAPQVITPSIPTSAVEKKRNLRQKPNEVERFIDYPRTKKQPSLDAVDHLFLSYANSFKRFSDRNKILLKLELAKLFAETELKEIENQPEPMCTATYSDSHNTSYPVASPENRIPSEVNFQQTYQSTFSRVMSPTSRKSSTDTNLTFFQCKPDPSPSN